MSLMKFFIKGCRAARWAAILLIMPLSVSGVHSDVTKNVLVLHAYHQGSQWTDHITEGIQSVLKPFGRDIALYFEYLDMHRASDEADFERLAELLQLKLHTIAFDVVLVAGERALNFFRQHGDLLAQPVPVVFCGVSFLEASTLAGSALETGVLTRLDHDLTLRLMLDLHPDARRLVVLIDRGAIGSNLAAAFEDQIEFIQDRKLVEIWYDPVWEELPAKLVSLSTGDLIYLLAFDPDQDLCEARAAETAQLIARWSPVPVYSSLGFYLGKGIVGGKITSGFHQGERAAQMALRILSGESAANIPTVTHTNRYMFDGRALRRFNIGTDRLPPDSIILHPEAPFLERHAMLFAGMAGGVLLLCIVLSAVAVHQSRRHRDLTKLNAVLDVRTREKSAQLQLAHQRLKKQTLVDGVTGLSNRRHVYQRFSEEAKKAQRYNQPLSIIIFDIDTFKSTNLEHGYAAGDMILRDVGQTIKRGIREIDLVGRYSGEEFLVALPNTSLDQCRQTAERIQQAIAVLQWGPDRMQITVSAAMAQLHDHHSPADLVRLAGERLAETKPQGPGRIVSV
jgi:diguanylate cyclase (GGDEF)-like protein